MQPRQPTSYPFAHLRLVPSDLLSAYQANTELLVRQGNEAFAAAMQAGGDAHVVRPNAYRTPWILYHAWRPGRVQIDAGTADLIRHLMAGREPGPEHLPIVDRLKAQGWCDGDAPANLDELVLRTRDSFLAIQNDHELRAFLGRVQALRPRVVVEIGTARGGMLYCFSQLSLPDATLVSIDLPGAANCGGQTDAERQVFATFCPPTQRMHFIPADSHQPATREQLLSLLAGRKVDLLFIDGDHSYEGCLKDFEMYRDLVDPAGMLAFHDICLFPEQWPGTGVGPAWQEVKARYGGEEIIDPDGVSTPQLQPGQRWKWGIGVVEAWRLASTAGSPPQ